MSCDVLEDETWTYRMCEPCSEVRHEECCGAQTWCECFVELMWEAEDMGND